MAEVVVVNDVAPDEEEEKTDYNLVVQDCFVGMGKTYHHVKMFAIPAAISLAIGILFFGLFKIGYFPRFDDYQGYLTFAVLLSAIAFLTFEFPADLVFVTAAFILCMCGVIKEKNEWSGLSKPAILAVGSICAVVKGLENTHLFKLVLKPIINLDNYTFANSLQIYSLAGLCSGFLNTTAVIAIFKNICHDYSQKSGASQKCLMQPLSFLAMAAARLTIIGSSTALMTQIILKDQNKKPFPIFAPFIYAVTSFCVLCPFCIWYAKMLHSVAPEENDDVEVPESRNTEAKLDTYRTSLQLEETHEKHTMYICMFKVGLKTKAINIELAKKEWGVQILKIQHGDVDKKFVANEDIEGYSFQPGDVVYIAVPINRTTDVIEFLEWNILEINTDHLAPNRTKHIVWAEAYVHPWSKLVGKKYEDLSKYTGKWTAIGIRTTDKNHCLIPEVDSTLEKVIKSGHKILLAGDRHAVDHPSSNFVAFHVLTDADVLDIFTFQIIISALCLIGIVVSQVATGLSLLQVIIMSLILLLSTECLTTATMFKSFKWRTVMMVAGGLGVCTAVTDAKVGALLGDWILKSRALYDGDWVPCLCLWILMVLLGFVLSPGSCMFIATPVIGTLQEELSSVTEHQLIMLCLASACFQVLSPFNSKNQLVADTGYSFFDWPKLGLPLVLIDGMISFPIIMWLYPKIYPTLFCVETYDGILNSSLVPKA